MNKLALYLSAFIIGISIFGIIVYASSQGIDVLEPAGAISAHQRDLFYIAVGLGLAALIPVFILTIIIISKYKVSDSSLPKKTKTKFEVRPEASWVWAGFISLIILVLSVIMLKSTHAIDPYKQLSAEVKPLTVRVVALPWKWLFIYPEERIATINELVVPEDRPLHFELTADAPMSSFWIPKLGGMIYTMEGMVTQLNLIANETGTYEGINTEINGKGYADMNFTTRAVTDNEYTQWLEEVRHAPTDLDDTTYERLTKETIDHPVKYYASADPALFGRILSKFMNHNHHESSHSTDTHQTH